MLDLRRLRAFHEVAGRGSFSAAAQALTYTQSVVSHHVAALEAELGVTLLQRTRPVRLTEAGERLHHHTEAILGRVAAAEADLRALAGLETGTLRVGAFLTACTSFVPAALARFTARHPGVEVRLTQLEPPTALPRLRAGELDVAVVWDVFDAEPDDEGLERRHLGDDPMSVVLPPGHRLARRDTVRLAELAGERFAGPRRDGGPAGYRAMLDRVCGEAGFTPDVTHEVDDTFVGRSFVAAGLSIALMPELALPHPRPDVAVRPLRDVAPLRSVSAAWPRGRRMPGVPEMVRLLEEAAGARLARAGA